MLSELLQKLCRLRVGEFVFPIMRPHYLPSDCEIVRSLSSVLPIWRSFFHVLTVGF